MTDETTTNAGAATQAQQEQGQMQGQNLGFPALKKAEEMLKKLEERENLIKDREAELDKKFRQMDQAAAEARLSGYGQIRAEKSADEIADENARNVIKGTGMEDWIFPQKKK